MFTFQAVHRYYPHLVPEFASFKDICRCCRPLDLEIILSIVNNSSEKMKRATLKPDVFCHCWIPPSVMAKFGVSHVTLLVWAFGS